MVLALVNIAIECFGAILNINDGPKKSTFTTALLFDVGVNFD